MFLFGKLFGQKGLDEISLGSYNSDLVKQVMAPFISSKSGAEQFYTVCKTVFDVPGFMTDKANTLHIAESLIAKFGSDDSSFVNWVSEKRNELTVEAEQAAKEVALHIGSMSYDSLEGDDYCDDDQEDIVFEDEDEDY